MNEPMPLRSLRQTIRPAAEAEPQPCVSADLRSPVALKLVATEAPGISGEVVSGSRLLSEIRNEQIVHATKGQRYAFWHRCHGYAFGRFPTERAARLWGMTYGYQFDGKWNG